MMNLRDVAIADVTAEGWMKISITTGPNFDEAAFTQEVAETLTAVTGVRSYGSRPDAQALPEMNDPDDRRALELITA
jgi:hypothetical protein